MADSTINQFVSSGTTAERTAYVPVPPTPAAGPDPAYLWWDTDTQTEWSYDFGLADWVELAGGGGSGTVTNTGALTEDTVIVGNGGVDVKALALGTALQVLRVNAGATAVEFGTAGGAGTVTNTGTLTDHALVVGNGGVDVSALASLGTTTTVLHGNATGDPTFGAVALAADVSGDLPLSNLAQASTDSVLLGRGDSSAGDFQEITLGSNLTMTGTTLAASGSGGTVVVDAAGALDGDGSGGDPLLVIVDNTTIQINGSNELEVIVSGSGGALTFLGAGTASASASLDFATVFSSTYNTYMIVLETIVPATNSAIPYLRFSTDGSTFDSGTNYAWSHMNVAYGGVAGSNNAVGTTAMNLFADTAMANGISNAFPLDMTLTVSNPLGSAFRKNVMGQGNVVYAVGPTSFMFTFGGIYTPTTALTGFQFLFSTGNITSGVVRVYGYEK